MILALKSLFRFVCIWPFDLQFITAPCWKKGVRHVIALGWQECWASLACLLSLASSLWQHWSSWMLFGAMMRIKPQKILTCCLAKIRHYFLWKYSLITVHVLYMWSSYTTNQRVTRVLFLKLFFNNELRKTCISPLKQRANLEIQDFCFDKA